MTRGWKAHEESVLPQKRGTITPFVVRVWTKYCSAPVWTIYLCIGETVWNEFKGRFTIIIKRFLYDVELHWNQEIYSMIMASLSNAFILFYLNDLNDLFQLNIDQHRIYTLIIGHKTVFYIYEQLPPNKL